MTITHIVLFQFAETTSEEQVRDICQRMLGLKDKCLHATTQKPYIIESSGGRDNSIEGHQGGLTHGFVVKFASEEDRNYYVQKDPAHAEFVKSLDGLMTSARVLDFTPGVL